MFKLMLMFVASLMLMADLIESANQRLNQQVGSPSIQVIPSSQVTSDADPMEPCYLANNRASESLTISESTPVGTVVGEIMVSFVFVMSFFCVLIS